jgi:hypothetical protein
MPGASLAQTELASVFADGTSTTSIGTAEALGEEALDGDDALVSGVHLCPFLLDCFSLFQSTFFSQDHEQPPKLPQVPQPHPSRL